MPELTIRDRIIAAVVARLGQITQAAGYSLDLGPGQVHRAKASFGEGDVLPAVTVFAQVEEVAFAHGVKRHTMPVEVVAAALVGDGNASEIAEPIYGDLVRCLEGSQRLGGLADMLVHTGGGVDSYPSADQGDQAVAVVALFNITYETVPGDPGTQP